MDKYEVIFYETEDGTRPAYDFIETLSPKMQAKIYKIASMLEMDGTRLRLPYSEFLKDGIFQIRAQQEGNISRVLYFFAIGKRLSLQTASPKRHQRPRPAKSNWRRNTGQTTSEGRL